MDRIERTAVVAGISSIEDFARVFNEAEAAGEVELRAMTRYCLNDPYLAVGLKLAMRQEDSGFDPAALVVMQSVVDIYEYLEELAIDQKRNSQIPYDVDPLPSHGGPDPIW